MKLGGCMKDALQKIHNQYLLEYLACYGIGH